MKLLSRRSVLVGAGLLGARGAGSHARRTGRSATSIQAQTGGFKLRYAPHFGMFRHHAGADLLDQLRFVKDEGFTALEDNGMAGREVSVQSSIAGEMERLDMEMGVFVAHTAWGRVSFASDKEEDRQKIRSDIEHAVEVGKRVNATWCTVVLGDYARGVPFDYQTANVVDNLRMAAELCEPSGLVMVLEPLNHWTDHAGVFLTGVPQAYQICRAVDSPSVKILDDLYHQQITEGNLIPNLDRAWDEIAYIQVGDNPGRKEPGTGEINYGNVFAWLHRKGYDGIVGMEHGNSMPGREGERAVIDAYKRVDAVIG